MPKLNNNVGEGRSPSEVDAGIREHHTAALQRFEEAERSSMEADKKKLEQAAKKELEQATVLVIQAYGKELRSWLIRRLENPSLGEDLYQEVCLGLWRGLRTFRWDSSLRTWLYRISFHVICHHTRTAPKSYIWAHLLRDVRKLSKVDHGPLPKRLASTLTKLHLRVVRAHEMPETREEETQTLQRELNTLAQDPELRRHPQTYSWSVWISEHLTELVAAMETTAQQPVDCTLNSEVLSHIAQEVSSMGGRLDRRDQVEASLQELKEHDRILILLWQGLPVREELPREERDNENWKDIARAWNNYRSTSEKELKAEAAALRKRYERAKEKFKEIARKKGLQV